MDPTEFLRNEHRLIEQVIRCLERLLDACTAGQPLDKTSAQEALEFLAGFADGYHHSKEEEVLFPAMEAAGLAAQTDPMGLLRREHSQGRAHVRAMGDLLAPASQGDPAAIQQFVAHGRAYIELFREHIRNEDSCVFGSVAQAIHPQAREQLAGAMAQSVANVPDARPYEAYIAMADRLADRLGVPRAALDTDSRPRACNCSLYADLVQQKALIERQNLLLTRELELARQVQQALIPRGPQSVDGLEIAWVYEPAAQVGGDVLDIIRLPGQRVLLFVGDAMGHGAPAALLMCMVKTALQSAVANCPSPARVLAHINQLVFGMLDSHFVTAACCLVDPGQGDARLSLAGHAGPLWFRSASREVVAQGAIGLPLGIAEQPHYEETHIKLQPEDVLFFYTDGIIEACGRGEEQYGHLRLTDLVRRHGRRAADGLLARVRRDLARHCNGRVMSDDLTLLAIRAVPRKRARSARSRSPTA